MTISKAISAAMNKQGLTPSDLARMTGYSSQYIIDVLKGNRRWNETTIAKACAALGLEIKFVPAKERCKT